MTQDANGQPTGHRRTPLGHAVRDGELSCRGAEGSRTCGQPFGQTSPHAFPRARWVGIIAAMTEAPRLVGRYEILREVGRGGMASVHLARQTDLDRFVALKELHAFHASDPSIAQRFLRESRLAGSLSHAKIVTVHEYLENNGTPYIAMEYLPRGSLRPHVGRTTLTQTIGVLESVLVGLAHAERRSIVHRDLKPENLLLTEEGSIKIADFGIAKARDRVQPSGFLTATGTAVGTPTYMAPEQAMAQELGPWTDLYSVGVVAWELLVGHTPFYDTDTPVAILMRQVNEAIPPAISVAPEVPAQLSAWVDRLLVKDPAARTASASVAYEQLEEVAVELVGPHWRRATELDRVSERGPSTPYQRTAPPAGVQAPPATPAPAEKAPAEGEAEPPADDANSDSLVTFAPGSRQPLLEADSLPELEDPPLVGTVDSPPLLDAVPATPAPATEPGPPSAEPERAPAEPEPPPAEPERPVPAADEATIMPTVSPRPRVPAGAHVVRRRTVALAVVAGIVAVAAGALLSSGGDPHPSPSERAQIGAGGLRWQAPAGWDREPHAPAVSGVKLRDTAAARSRGATIVSGYVATRPGTRAPWPPPASSGVGARATPQPVDLGGGVRALRLDGAETIYAVPTTDGVAVLACARTPADACGAAAASFRPISGRPLPIGPDPAFAATLRTALSPLTARAETGQRRLARSRTRGRQAAAARSLASAYARAADTIAAARPTTTTAAPRAQIIRGLRRAASAYKALGAAAATGDRGGYRRARVAVGEAGAALTAIRKSLSSDYILR